MPKKKAQSTKKTVYPVKRELDGAYFRVERDGKAEDICFSDLTEQEMFKVIEKWDIIGLRRMCVLLGETLHIVGDHFDIIAKEVEEES
jgi:hypothetical protein